MSPIRSRPIAANPDAGTQVPGHRPLSLGPRARATSLGPRGRLGYPGGYRFGANAPRLR